MKMEIRQSFTKDADKLPNPFQQQLAAIIETIEKVGHPKELPHCKKLTGYKTAYRIRMGPTESDFIMKLKRLNWCGY